MSFKKFDFDAWLKKEVLNSNELGNKTISHIDTSSLKVAFSNDFTVKNSKSVIGKTIDTIASKSFAVNNTSVEQSYIYNDKRIKTFSYHWAVTKGISLGISQDATVSVPGTAEFSSSLSATFSMSKTQSNTQTETHTYSWSVPVKVPANKSVTCEVLVQPVTTTADLEIQGEFTGDFFANLASNGIVEIGRRCNLYDWLAGMNLPPEITVDSNSQKVYFKGLVEFTCTQSTHMKVEFNEQ